MPDHNESDNVTEQDGITDEMLFGLPPDGRRVVRLMAAGGWDSGRPSRAAVQRTINALGLSFEDEQVRGEPRAFWPVRGQGPTWRRLADRLDAGPVEQRQAAVTTTEWGVVVDDIGSADMAEGEQEARDWLAAGEGLSLVRVVVTEWPRANPVYRPGEST